MTTTNIDENASKTTDTRPGMNELEERIYKRTVKMLFNAARDPDSGAGDAA